MNHKNSLRTILAALMCLTIIIGGCGQSDVGKMPVTTSSKEAMDHFMNGRALFDKLRATDALVHFEKAVKADSTFALAYLYTGFSTGTAKGFFANLDKAVALSDQVSEGERLWILSSQAAANGETMKQKEYLQKLVAAYPNCERANTLLGNFLFGIQDYEGAIAQYEKANTINPDYSQPYNQLGYAHRFLENYEAAEKAFKKYIELIPDDPNPYDSYAELLMKTGKFEESTKHYRKALDVNPEFFNSYTGIASNLNYLGRYEEARSTLQDLLQVARTDGERRGAFFATALSYMFEGFPGKALDAIREQYAIAEATNDRGAMSGDLNLMGNILFELGKYDKALLHYEKANATALDSDLSDKVKANNTRNFMYNQARVALMKKDMKTAKELAAKHMEEVTAVQNTFQTWLSHNLAGMIACADGEYDNAIAHYEQANLQNPYTLFRIGSAYEKKGDKKAAKEYYTRAADFNALNNMNQAFIKDKVAKKLASM